MLVKLKGRTQIPRKYIPNTAFNVIGVTNNSVHVEWQGVSFSVPFEAIKEIVPAKENVVFT